MIAGLVGIWLVHGQDPIPEEITLGKQGRHNTRIDVCGLAEGLKTFEVPSCNLVYFGYAPLPASCRHQLCQQPDLVELPPMLDKDFEKQLDLTPKGFKHNILC